MSDQNPTQAQPTPPFPEQEHGRLKGKVALIAGADSGIGRAVAIAFAREGADSGRHRRS